ncbi:hypothetical protein H4217_004636, partial [Coemansia sp. RSA 1939]
ALQQPMMRPPNNTESAANNSAVMTGDSMHESSPRPKHRYLTRSVAHNAARIKQEQHQPTDAFSQYQYGVSDTLDTTEDIDILRGTTSRFTFEQTQLPRIVEAVASGQTNPYYMMTAANEQRQQPQTWTSTALYQAARAVAAAATTTSNTQRQQQQQQQHVQSMSGVNPVLTTLQTVSTEQTGPSNVRTQR